MDPSTMTDDELKNVIETGIEPEAPAVEEETPEEEVVEEVEETPEEEAPKEDIPEEKPASRREQLRINQLLEKYGNPTERVQAPLQKRADALDYAETLDADEDVISRLQADRQANGDERYNEGLKRAEFLDWRTSLKIDAPNVEKKYPILDKNSEEFHPAVANALNSWYLKMSGFNAQNQTVGNTEISYSDFVEANMELVEEIAGQKNTQSVKNIAKQAANTGLRPDGSSPKRLNLNQSEKTMSIDELYAAIGQKAPKK